MSEELKRLMEAAYLAGFNASGEGYNGEYPFQDTDEHPEDDGDWCETRDKTLAELRELMLNAQIEMRERCAMACERYARESWEIHKDADRQWAGKDCAEAIRALPLMYTGTEPRPSSVE